MTTDNENKNRQELPAYIEKQLDEMDAVEVSSDMSKERLEEKGFIGNKPTAIAEKTTLQETENEHLLFEADVDDERLPDVLLTAGCIEGADQPVITLTDITYQKEIQEQLKKKNLEILEFTNMVIHDLRKPLTAMTTIMNLADKGAFGTLNADGVEGIRTGVEAANYMKEMLEDLMTCAKLEAGTQVLTIEATGFMKLVGTVTSQLKYQIEENKIRIETVGEEVVVPADRKQLTRVLMNLVGNAVNYIGDGPDKYIRIGWEQRNGDKVFFVKDNGIGIPEKSQKRLFNKFSRGSNVSGITGTGLGLFIAKGIVEAHGGNICFESEVGKGTTCYFTLCGNDDCSSVK